ncbi:YPTC6 [Symbiodinium natans]|uniref:YPTC6 protein n=1 Tax=Symbiodinium natans TaxID=878477 RepID=A0A812N996_9DINO|nr:YPTC6 [Symbiodinium natans]
MIGEEDYDHLYKLVLVGDATVGKTHILSRYIKGTLPKAPTATIGVEFATRTVSLDAGCTVKAQIWDTAGQERYRAITSAHYRRAVGALLVYDITKPATFKSCQRWMEELRSNAEPDIVIMLVGNKVDLAEKHAGDRQVDFDTAADFASQQGLLFEEASAVTGANIKLCFEKLLREIYNTTQHRRDREDLSSNLQLQGRTLSVNTNLHIYSVHPYSSISRRMSYTTRNCYEIRSTSVQSWKSRLAALPFVRTSAQRCEDAKGRENK